MTAARPFVTREHLVPGRVRLRVAGLRRYPSRIAALSRRLGEQSGVLEVVARAMSESVIVRYDPAQADPLEIVEVTRRFASDILPHAAIHARRSPDPPHRDPETVSLLLSFSTVALAIAEAP